jgi:hypothetical protein
LSLDLDWLVLRNALENRVENLLLFIVFIVVDGEDVAVGRGSFRDFVYELGQVLYVHHRNSVLLFGHETLLQPGLFEVFVQRKLLLP